MLTIVNGVSQDGGRRPASDMGGQANCLPRDSPDAGISLGGTEGTYSPLLKQTPRGSLPKDRGFSPSAKTHISLYNPLRPTRMRA